MVIAMIIMMVICKLAHLGACELVISVPWYIMVISHGQPVLQMRLMVVRCLRLCDLTWQDNTYCAAIGVWMDGRKNQPFITIHTQVSQ